MPNQARKAATPSPRDNANVERAMREIRYITGDATAPQGSGHRGNDSAMELTDWIRSRAASGQPLNLHAVARERPDLLEMAFGGPNSRGWRGSLIDAGVDPYGIIHEYEDLVECAICGRSLPVLGSHLKSCHGLTGDEYREEFGPHRRLSSESFRATKFEGRLIAGIGHWERLWSRHYVTDWILRLHEEGYDVNYQNLVEIGRSLASYGWSLFGSWDAALRSAGLDPDLERSIPPFRQWTRTMVIEGLRNFAKLRQENRRREMSIPLRMAIRRFFKTMQAACRAAGVDFEEINPRVIPMGEPVVRLLSAIRTLESLKGSERRRRLDAIYLKNKVNHRIVVGHYGSLRKLAVREGIDPKNVDPATYRDEADVLHDLDLLVSDGTLPNFSTLKKGNKRLYNVIRETGWGAARLKSEPRRPFKYPPCDPRSGLLRDRMIILRRRLRISTVAAAHKAGLSMDCWIAIEKGETKPKPPTVAKIERLLDEHQIPVSTAPHTSIR